MRAVKAFGPRDVRLVEVPRPEPGPGEALIRVEACAICPTELHIYLDWDAGGKAPERPFIMGHEFSGIVAEVGPRCSLRPGVRLAVEPSRHCGQCDMCRAGRFNICRNITFPSFPPTDGAQAEYIACPEYSVKPVPSSVSAIEAALIEPLAVAVHAVRLAEVAAEETLAVLGAGAIGLSVLQVARAWGVRRVWLAEPRPERRALARKFGAEVVCASAAELRETLGSSPRVVIEAAGHDRCLADAVELADTGGRVYVIGVPFADEQALSMRVARRKELLVHFVRRSCSDLDEAVELVVTGRVNLRDYPVLCFSPEQAQEAFAAAIARPGDMLRAVILWS